MLRAGAKSSSSGPVLLSFNSSRDAPSAPIGSTLKAVHLPTGGSKKKHVDKALNSSLDSVTAVPPDANTGASYLSSLNPKYSVKSSGSIVAVGGVGGGKKVVFGDD